jgi:Bacterial archaeo-eukaryotic release factor family 3
MDALEQDYSSVLLAVHEPPCLSLYQPTHRHHPDNQQDPIRFRNLVKAMEASLRQKYAARETRPLLASFHALVDDREFWNHTLDGLAVLATSDIFKVYRLQRPVPELAVVADSFHTKPLLRILQSADRYQILGLNRQEVRLFEGNRDALDEIDPAPGVPRTIAEALEQESDEPERKNRVYGAAVPQATTRHGTDVREDKLASDTERFFRAVDRAVLEHHSRPTGMPLLLAALPEHHHVFRAVSRNPFLMAEAIDVHPDALSLDALRERAWLLVQPQYLRRLSGLIERFNAAKSNGLGSDDLAQVAAATAAGRIATLLIEADRQIPGAFDAVTGAIKLDDFDDPEVDDLLDDLGERALKAGGEVVVVPAERMPTETGIAAIYRF